MRRYRRWMRRRRRGDVGARRGDVGARSGDVGARRRSRGVTGDIGAEFTAISVIAELVQLRRCVTELLIMEI